MTATDIPRIYSAVAEWLSCMLYVFILRKRFSKGATVLISAGFLIVQCLFMTLTGNIPIVFWIPCMLVAVMLTLGALFLLCKVPVRDAAFFGIHAFVTAEFMAAFSWQIDCFFFPGEGVKYLIGRVSTLVFIYAGISFLFVYLLKKFIPASTGLNVSGKELFATICIGVCAFAVSNLSFISTNTPFSGRYSAEIANIRTLVDAAGLALLSTHLLQCCELRTKNELEAVQTVLQNQYLQYMNSRESIDLINYKYHDLKHQIAALRLMQDSEARNEFLDKMEDSIKQYELANKTGNSVLDTVLTSKNISCDKNGIVFTSVADGTLLSFMDVTDICSIFGNALDNAIECEMRIGDPEKRLIHTTLSKQKNFLIIRFENYFEGKLDTNEGKLVTTKADKKFHGYGMESIRYTVLKYNGAVSYEVKDNWFTLKILIPIP